MSKRTIDNKMVFYTCGRCGNNIYYRKKENVPIPCPECGTKGTGDYDPTTAWKHTSASESNVPTSFKFNIKQF